MKETVRKEKHNLLIVEDDAHLRETLATFLTRAGYDVAQAHDGREALEALDKEAPDLVLTDIHMPDLDGLALLAEVKARYPETIVIMMTAFSSIDAGNRLPLKSSGGSYTTGTKPSRSRRSTI